MAVAQSTESSGIVFAGINSSGADQNAGRNEHLRSFELRYPPKKKTAPDATETLKNQALESKAATKALGRASLFTPSSAEKKETYQRILRLSRPNQGGTSRLGAIATGLAPEGEIIAFNAGTESPTNQDVLRRIRLGRGEEATDVDVMDTQSSGCHLAYCTDHEAYVVRISPTETAETDPILIYSTQHRDASASTTPRPRLRFLRFLTLNLLLLLQNKPNRSGAELLLLEIHAAPSLNNIVLRKHLHRSIQTATALSVSVLPAADPSQNIQTVVAVAGQNNSIEILTLDHSSKPPFSSCKFRQYALLRNVHELQITSLTLSMCHLPLDFSSAPPQYLKLASTSINSTVVVHTLPLKPYPLPSATRRSNRYVLTSPGRSEATQMTFSIFISALVIALGALVLQAFSEIRGGTPEYLGAKGWLSDRLHGWIARPYMFDDVLDRLSVPGVETRPMKGVQSQLGDIKNSVKDALKKPDAVKVRGVETRPLEGMKSQDAEMKDTLKETFEQPGGHAASDIERSGKSIVEGPKRAARHAQQSVAKVTHQARASVAAANKKLGLRDLLSRRRSPDPKTASLKGSASDIVVRHDEANQALSADVRGSNTLIEETHKKWEELEQHERETWKKRLIDAGEWAVEEGEAVLKGVFFQNIALAVGAAVQAGL